MKILGIETSCDETAAAVVENGTHVLSNVIASQISLHAKTGGVVPEVAAREHVVKIVPVVEAALEEADVTMDEIDAVAYTQGPGLLSSLIIGATAGSLIGGISGKKLIPMNHVAGHIYANWLGLNSDDEIEFPVVVLTVSGGHNDLALMKSHGSFELIGETLDDAAGEAFDKVARLLGLGYPGGPHISRAAEKGDSSKFKLPLVYLDKETFNFSFSGLKTSVLNLVNQEIAGSGSLDEQFVSDCAASFQEAVCQVLSDKLLRAAKQFCAREVHLAGGVSANNRLRELTSQKIETGYFHNLNKKITLGLRPKLRYANDLSLCTDNAAMIAGAAYFCGDTTFDAGNVARLADPNLSLYDVSK